MVTIWALISILNFALCVYLFYRLIKQMGVFANVSPEDKRPTQMPQETALWFLDLYINVFKTLNLASVYSIMSDSMFCSVSMAVQTLNRLGLRREIFMDPFPPNADDPVSDTVVADGKGQASIASLQCKYVEQYVDSTTDSILYEYAIKKADIDLCVVRSALRTEEQAGIVYCLNCGSEVETSGELFICKHCGTTYRSDSYDWVVDEVVTDFFQAIPNPFKRLATKFVGYAIVPAFILTPILGLFAGSRPMLKTIVILINAAVLLITLWALENYKKDFAGINQLTEYDPLVSKSLGGRFNYLLRRVYYSHDFNPEDIRTMMDAGAYSQWLASHQHSGNYILEVQAAVMGGKPSFSLENGRQYFDCEFECTLLVLTPQRQIQTANRKFRIAFYRNQATRYTHTLEAQSMICAGCGNSMDFTVDGICKYCGREYDVADFDWKIAYISPEAFV